MPYLAVQLLLLSGVLHAQPPVQGHQPPVVEPLNGFHFSGEWQCTGMFRGGKVHRAAFAASMVLEGKWLQLQERDVEPATGYVAIYLIGVDPAARRLVEFDANNFGAATYSSESGWVDGVLTMTSTVLVDAKAAYAVNRFIYTVVAPDSFLVDWQISKTPDANWVPADHLLCRRA